MLWSDRNLVPVAVLQEGQGYIDERWHLTWGENLCLCCTATRGGGTGGDQECTCELTFVFRRNNVLLMVKSFRHHGALGDEI